MPEPTTTASTPHPLSADYSALSEMAYRRAPDANPPHIDTVEGVQAVNLLESPGLQAAADAWRDGADVATFVKERYGLTIDPLDRGDGLTHIYSESGFSGHVTLRDNGMRGDGTDAPSDDQYIVTFRGTDMADNADGEMLGGLVTAGSPLVASATYGVADIGLARSAQPDFDTYRAEIEHATGAPYSEFTVQRGPGGEVLERLVDAGDVYSNGLLGQGTYHATQYDDASALFDLVADHVASDDGQMVVNGQSLGGGLAALVGVEKGVETHTFGMAPFQKQFEIIGQRNMVETLITDPDMADRFGQLGRDYQSGSLVQRHAIEREFSDRMSRLGTETSGHDGRNHSIRIREFNEEFGTRIDRDTIEAFKAGAQDLAGGFEANKATLHASTVAGEFTTNSGAGSLLGHGVEFGSEQIVPTSRMHTYDIGDNQVLTRAAEIQEIAADGGHIWPTTGLAQLPGTIGMGEGLSAHSTSLHDLITASQPGSSARMGSDAARLRNGLGHGLEDGHANGSDALAGGFDELLAGNPTFRYSVFHQPGALGGVASGKVGPQDDPSASRSTAAGNDTVYRALSNSLRSDGVLYADTHDMFTTLGTVGRGAQGADDLPSDATLNGAVTRIAVQDLRIRTAGLAPGDVPGADAGVVGNHGDGSGLLSFDLHALEPTDDRNRMKGAGGDPLDGLDGLYGYTDLKTVLYEEVRSQIPAPDDTEIWEIGGRARTRIADELTGARQDYRLLGTVESNLDFPNDALGMRWLYVQSGHETDRDLDLQDRYAAETAAGEPDGSFGVFMDDGDNAVRGSQARDLVSLGAGNDSYTSAVQGGALVSAGDGLDTYAVEDGTGPVFASLSEGYMQVGRLEDYSAAADGEHDLLDTVVGAETTRLGTGNDFIVVRGVSDDLLVDGGLGRDTVDYRLLDADFRLDLEDGVTAAGDAYTSRLTNGARSVYFVNVDDQDITRGNEAGRSGLADTLSGTDPATTRVDLRTATSQLATDIGVLKTLPPDHSDIDSLARDLAGSPLPLAVANTLHTSSATSLEVDVDAQHSVQTRIVAAVESGLRELESRGVSRDDVEAEYEALRDREADRDADLDNERDIERNVERADKAPAADSFSLPDAGQDSMSLC